MDSVNKTLYIPLYGKAMVSKKGIILNDPKAEFIWQQEGFELKGKAKSKWLTYYMAMRSRVFDDWLREQMNANLNAVVLHLGCGMDSRVERVGTGKHLWYDVDFQNVISARQQYYMETELYHMIASDIRDTAWLKEIPVGNAIIVMEGISMYLQLCELQTVLSALTSHFEDVVLLMDCYTEFAAKATKYKSPINEVGVTTVYGLNNPKMLEQKSRLHFVREHDMTPQALVDELNGFEKYVFQKVFAGNFAKKMYCMYEFK